MLSLEWIMEAIQEKADDEGIEIKRIRTFEEAGLLTRNNGILVETEDGEEYQMTVIMR